MTADRWRYNLVSRFVTRGWVLCATWPRRHVLRPCSSHGIKETRTRQHDVDHPIGKAIELILERFYFRIEWPLPSLLSLLYLSRYLPSFFLFRFRIIIFLLGLFNYFSSKFFYLELCETGVNLWEFPVLFFIYLSIEIFVGIFKTFLTFPRFLYSLLFFPSGLLRIFSIIYLETFFRN